MQADYSQQLTAIVSALRQPSPWWTNSWILAAFSAFLGVVGGFIGQLILNIHADRQTRKTLLWYGYTGQVLAVLDTLASTPGFQDHHAAGLLLSLPTTPEEYTKAHSEIYAKLLESISFDVILNAAKMLQQPSFPYDRINVARQTIIQQFRKKRLAVEAFRKYRGKEEAATFAELLARHEPAIRDKSPMITP